MTGRTHGRPGRVIAEVAQAHGGDLMLAHAYIDAIAAAGADAVKFQTHIAAAESTPHEPWRVRFSLRDATRYDYWKRMEFTPGEWQGLKRHAAERGLAFLSSPFSMEAVELLERIGVDAWKIPSGEITNHALLDRVSGGPVPVLLSTGMSAIADIDAAAARVARGGAPLTVMQCTSEYPCPPEHIGLNMLDLFRARYRCDAGLSDHSGTIYPSLAAVALGAAVVEVHVTMSRELPGPDAPASITTAELKQLVEGVRFIETAVAHPVDKDTHAEAMAPMRRIFTKSVVARRALPSGATIGTGDVACRKPGTGIPAADVASVIGRRLRRAVAENDLLQLEDFEDVPG